MQHIVRDIVLGMIILAMLVGGAYAFELSTVYNPWTGKLDYINDENQTDIYYADEDWINKNVSDAFVFNDSKLSTTYYLADSINVVTGTGAGTLAYIQTYDTITYNVTESLSDFELIVNFTGITEFTTLIVRHKTDADAGHSASIQIWDYTDSDWEGYGHLTESLTAEIKTLGVYDDSDHIQDGVVQVRFYQVEVGNAGHIHQFDWVGISKGYGTPAGQEIDPLSVHRDGNTPLTDNWDAGAFEINASRFNGLWNGSSAYDDNNYNHTSSTYDLWGMYFFNQTEEIVTQDDCSAGNYSYGFYANGSQKCRSDVSGIASEVDPIWTANLTSGVSAILKPMTASAFDLGTSSLRWLTGYFNNLNLAGNVTMTGTDIYANITWNGDITMNEGNISMINTTTCYGDTCQAQIYHNGSSLIIKVT